MANRCAGKIKVVQDKGYILENDNGGQNFYAGFCGLVGEFKKGVVGQAVTFLKLGTLNHGLVAARDVRPI